jgi:hypothetical protein
VSWVPFFAAAVVTVGLVQARRWLAVLVVIAVAGGPVQNHILLALPQTVAAPLARWNRELHTWQGHQAAALACAVAQNNSVTTGTTAAYAQAVNLCPQPSR